MRATKGEMGKSSEGGYELLTGEGRKGRRESIEGIGKEERELLKVKRERVRELMS